MVELARGKPKSSEAFYVLIRMDHTIQYARTDEELGSPCYECPAAATIVSRVYSFVMKQSRCVSSHGLADGLTTAPYHIDLKDRSGKGNAAGIP